MECDESVVLSDILVEEADNDDNSMAEEKLIQVQAALKTLQEKLETESVSKSQLQSLRLKPFLGSSSEDIDEWMEKFERFAKFSSWKDDKKVGALPLMLDGAAIAFYRTLDDVTKEDFAQLKGAITEIFNSPSLAFLLRQQLSARRMSPDESLENYIEDVTRRCHRLKLADMQRLHVFVQGLRPDLKEHVMLNRPKTYQKAETLARLKTEVSQSTSSAYPGQAEDLQTVIHALGSLLKQSSPSHSSLGACSTSKESSLEIAAFGPAYDRKPLAQLEVDKLRQELTAEIKEDIRLELREQDRSGQRRSSDGQPICNFCSRVGHVEQYCREKQGSGFNPALNSDRQSQPSYNGPALNTPGFSTRGR